jgi:CRP/FNR family transcriptional regulator, cyclic AMP receptor protein
MIAREESAAAVPGAWCNAAYDKRRTVTDITTLVQAVQTLRAADAFKPGLELAHWQAVSAYLDRRELHAGELLIRQADKDRSAYLLEQGNLQVFVSGGSPGSHRIAILRPGSMVGEPGLFAEVPRSANVEAMTPCVVWALSVPKLEELCTQLPAPALALVRAAGAVMAVRARASLERGMPMI